MASISRAGSGEGTERPDDIIIEHIEEFQDRVLFIGWRGNGYDEASCWMISDEENLCQLSTWE